MAVHRIQIERVRPKPSRPDTNTETRYGRAALHGAHIKPPSDALDDQ